jgi:hypothetical protein
MADDNTPQESEEEHEISLAHTLKRAKLEAEIAKHKQESSEKEQVFLDAKEKFEALTTDPIAFAKKLAKEKLLSMFLKKYRLQAQLDDLDNIEKKAKLKQDLEDDANKKQEAYDKLRGSIQPTTAVSEGGDTQNAVGTGLTTVLQNALPTGLTDDPITQNARLDSLTPVLNDINDFFSGFADQGINVNGLTPVLNDINDSIISGNDTQEEQLRTDKNQFKKDNTTSAAEEIAAGSGSKDASGLPSVDVEKPKKSKGFDLPNPMDGLNGIMGNVLGKFGKAGSFLMSLGSKFLMPLITTPVGWAVLAGLAVGGLVFAYWDEIKATISSIFDKVGDMMSAIGDSIMEIVDFLNPMNLLPMIAKALLPTEWYDAISGFFGGETIEESDTRGKRDAAGERVKQTESDAVEAEDDLIASMDRQQEASSDLSDLENATAIGIYPDGGISIQRDTINGRHNVTGAEQTLIKNGARIATEAEISGLIQSASDKLSVADMNVKHLTIKSNVADKVAYQAVVEHKELDDIVKGSEQKKKKPGNIVADLVRAGTAEWNVFGNSVIKDWPALRKLDYESLEKVLDFDDWGDNTKRGILSIMNSKKQLIGANDIGQEPQSVVALNPNVMNEKQRNIQNTNKLAMDNKVSDAPVSDNTTQITNAPTSLTNNTTNNTIEDKATDSDFTNLSLNRSPQYGMNAF